MREILFRGKCKETGAWLHGGFTGNDEHAYILDSGLNCASGFCSLSEDYINYYEVDPFTVGQYTGLIDKNGKKIFEGDIARGVYGGTTYQQEIIFVGGCFALRHTYDRFAYCAMLNEHESVEVIGNIYDNPELI